jgi:AcrR family transcriptional regulator
MPRTRADLNRDQKVSEILDRAEVRLREGGLDALSMIGIARELGLAQNAIYWYFPSRAHLFVAAMRRMLERTAARKPRGEVEVSARVLWWTDQFEPLYALYATMRDQARDSPIVAEFVQQLDDVLTRMLTNAFQGRMPADEVAPAVDSFRATVTGAYAQALSRRRRHQLLTFTLARLLR